MLPIAIALGGAVLALAGIVIVQTIKLREARAEVAVWRELDAERRADRDQPARNWQTEIL